MTKDVEITKEAITARIRVAAEALEIPREAVDHVIKHGTNPRTGKACKVLCEFAVEYGVSLDWLISGDIAALLKYASIGFKITMHSPHSKPQQAPENAA